MNYKIKYLELSSALKNQSGSGSGSFEIGKIFKFQKINYGCYKQFSEKKAIIVGFGPYYQQEQYIVFKLAHNRIEYSWCPGYFVGANKFSSRRVSVCHEFK